MTNSDRCIVIGGGSLLIRCTEILLKAGFDVLAAVSIDPVVLKWAKTAGIQCFSSTAEFTARSSEPFDYLFSIVNEEILTDEILRRPKELAINYHDAPLPRYAGTHATSWALLNGESTHGVSWHVITETVDAGDILVQKSVVVDKRDTALTLNTKCFEAAIFAFSELVGHLVGRTIVRTPQDETKRTFFKRFRRPQGGGLIDWSKSATTIVNLVRALDFGDHPNPLGVAKLAVGDQFFLVLECEELENASRSAFGTITAIGSDSLTVSTRDNEVRVKKICSVAGDEISVSDLTLKFGLTTGYRLSIPDGETLKRIDGVINAVARHEASWVRSISEFETISPPYSASNVSNAPTRFAKCRIPVPPTFLRYVNRIATSGQRHKHLVAGFLAMLARLSNVDRFDIAFTSVALREEISGLEPLFADRVPLRISLDAQKNFEEFVLSIVGNLETLKRHKTHLRDVYARFPQLLATENLSGKLAASIAIATAQGDSEYQPTEETEIAFVVSESESECYWIYDESKYGLEAVTRLTDHLLAFLSGIANDPVCKIAELPLLTEDERKRLLIEWNDLNVSESSSVQTGTSASDSISQLFEAQVLRDPDATALVFGDERTSYLVLNQRSNQVAGYLRKRGVCSEVLVGICHERSIEMIVSVLAVLKAGGAYVPLDPSYPKERINHMLSDSQASVLLTNDRLAGTFGDYQGTVISLNGQAETIAEEPVANLPVSPDSRGPNDLAYVIYTSGSTGNPKGVAIEQGNALALLEWAMTIYRPEQLKGVLASTSICFDLSVFEMFLPLACGGSIILVENILHLPGLPAGEEVSLINTVPSAISELLRLNAIPPSVKTVNLAGEPLKSSLVEKIYAIGTVNEVFDLYGPTEDTTYSTFKLRDIGRATIGRPIAKTQAYILDRHLQPVPIGMVGELYLGGAGLARGYLNQPELTNEKFIKNPFESHPSARIYKTGDLARFLENGEIEYLGRIDNQVKIRGFRIELGEIEARLADHPEITEVIVVAREDIPGDKRLVAYFVPKVTDSVDRNELRDYLSERLPDFMVPSAFVGLDEMPLTPNGKIDRKALPKPSVLLPENASKTITGRDTVERKLVEIWEKLLGVNPIGIRDNFFELGGHSLQAVRMFAELEETFRKNIPLATLFAAGTIEQLAEILRIDGWAEPESCLVPIQPDGTKPPFFCVHAKGGNVLFYRDLAKYLGTDQPFYGIQARRLGGRQVGHATVEEMADYYLSEIRAFQPKGPYFLGGSSFGGLAAFEMARRLYDCGESVGLLALFDTGTPDYPQRLPNVSIVQLKVNGVLRRIQQHVKALRELNARRRGTYILAKLAKVKLFYRRKFVGAYKKTVRGVYRNFNGVSPLPAKYIQIEDQIWRAGQNYQPGIYRGKLAIFRAAEQPFGIQPDPTLGWDRYVQGEMEIHEIPGHHGSIVAEPYVSVLADKLTECLGMARRDAGVIGGPVNPGFAEFGPMVELEGSLSVESRSLEADQMLESLKSQTVANKSS